MNRRIRNRIVGILLLALGSCAAFAQVDLSGEWKVLNYEDRAQRWDPPGTRIGDYLGLPINDAVRMRADTWMGSRYELQAWQCRPNSSDYMFHGVSDVTSWQEEDPVSRETTWHFHEIRSGPQDLVIHMDGSAHPPALAPYSWMGYATGKWEGNVLTVHITHLKEGYIGRNGVARSDKAEVTEHFIRHGDILTVVSIVYDPAYTTEPFIRSSDYQLDLNQHVPAFPCETTEIVDRPPGSVPNWAPGTNPSLHEFADDFHLPYDATRGGAETMYPEYRKKLEKMINPADYDKFILQPVRSGSE
jgi:hypothetical protein